MDDQKYWLGFSLAPGIGPKRMLRLYHHFGDLGQAWSASKTGLQAAGLDGKPLEMLLEHRKQLDLDEEIEKVRRTGAGLTTLVDADYPNRLKEADDAPPVLYVRGALTVVDDRAISIVGTRKATRYGRDVTFDLARQLAQQGITIVSGLAHGIDSAAHRGALKAGGRTIAVLGCGIDMIYPRDHTELAQKIAANGAIISEFPVGTQPIASNFPRRNRIVSGLSLGVLVTEAPEHSGALITAELAADQGREVFAVPSNIFNAMGRGANRLIQEGAKLVTGVEDILEELDIAYQNADVRTTTEQIAPESETERRLLQHLDVDPIHIDDLARLTGLPVQEVSSTLTILELKGVAQMVGHMQYSRVTRI